MYKLNYFTETDENLVIDFMRQYPFAIISANSDPRPVVAQVPLTVSHSEEGLVLTGHIMKNTDHHKGFLKNEDVVVVFSGPDCYVSASWYANPQVASTWNYMSVHAKGKITFGDEADTKKIIEDLTDLYEGKVVTGSFKNLPEAYVNKLVKAIIGFTIRVESLENIFKLSQNHEVENRKNIIAHLENGNASSQAIAAEMKKRIDQPKMSK